MSNHYQKANTEKMALAIRETAASKIISNSAESGDSKSEFNRLRAKYTGGPAHETISDDERAALYIALRDQHFAWVDECLARAASLPQPTATSNAIANTVQIAGEESFITPKGDEDGLEYLEESPGSGMYSSITFEEISAIKSSLNTWKSPAGYVFRQSFLGKITIAAANQLIAIKTIRNVAAANQMILEQASDDIFEIGNSTISVIEADDGCCGSDTDVNATLNVVAGVATIVAGIVSIPFTGGISTTAVAGGITALTGTLTTYTAAASASSPPEEPLAADTVEGVLDNMRRAIDTVYASLDDADKSLTSVMQSLHEAISSNPNGFRAPISSSISEATMETIVTEVE